MPLIYITGPSGAGKSTVRNELVKRGYEAHDTDEDGLSAWYNLQTGEKVTHPAKDRPPDWYKKHALKISSEKVEQLAEKAKNKVVFLCGIPANDLELKRYYDKILCLAIDEETMKQRVADRSTNNFGKSPDQLELMLYWHGKVLERYEHAGAMMIDATQSIDKVVDEVIKQAKKHMTTNIQNFLNTHQPKNGHFFTIAIDGRGGSGKSTFAELLKAKLTDFILLNGDDYFEPITDPIVWGEFNDERFVQDVIEPLRQGNSFVYRPYDWHAKPQITEKKIEITKGICFERCYSFSFDLDWDLKIWVETPKEVCLERGLARENMPREKSLPAWNIWQAKEDEYIAEFKPEQNADIVIDGLQPFEKQAGLE